MSLPQRWFARVARAARGASVSPTRRDLLGAVIGAGGIAIASKAVAQDAATQPASRPAASPPESAPAAPQGSAPDGIDAATLAAAERLALLKFTPKEREQVLGTIGDAFAIYESVRATHFDFGEAPAEVFVAKVRGQTFEQERRPPRWREADPGPCPTDDVDLAFASVASISRWIRAKQLTSERITRVCLARLREISPRLECLVTLTEESAIDRARLADREIAEGRSRGALHGIPYGLKDLFDTKRIRTTFGAEPYVRRIPMADAEVVRRLDEAGGVLVAKLSLGALAYGDRWFGGRTRNPWKLSQGSSGSSAGSAAAVAAGLVPYALGTETYGSIGSPCARCGATGIRPSFGRVSRAGVMPVAWTLDKVGPIARTVEDASLVLAAIEGIDPADPASVDHPLNFDFASAVSGMRVGFLAAEFEAASATDDDRRVLEELRKLGVKLEPVETPRGRYGELISFLIQVEMAGAFDEMTRSDQDDLLSWQAPAAWPNLLRTARFIPAVEHLQATRLRRRCMTEAAALFEPFDAVVAPSAHGPLHALTNLGGQPAVTIRGGFRADGTPRGLTLWGKLFGDGRLLRVASALERALAIHGRRPELR